MRHHKNDSGNFSRTREHHIDSHPEIKRTWRTLIVEDNGIFRQTLKNLLLGRFPFMEVGEAKDGEEADQKINGVHPDLIFMDIRLPGISGLELTKRIKKSKSHAVIIILTSHNLPEYREAATRCGADFFLTKGSATAEEILNLVDSILSEHFYPQMVKKTV